MMVSAASRREKRDREGIPPFSYYPSAEATSLATIVAFSLSLPWAKWGQKAFLSQQ